jgi:hypothetical protein
MENLFLELQKEIALGIPTLALVDEDYGQLALSEDTYPVVFPCVLINLSQIRWKTFHDDIQQGNVDVSIKLCIDCYHDTHYGSGTEDKIKERLGLLAKLHEIVSDIRPKGGPDPWERTESRFYTAEKGIKVYETVYNCLLDEGMME